MTVNIDKPDDVPFFMRDRALFRYLVNLKPETYDNHFHDIWREYGTYLIAENLLDLARKAKVCYNLSKLKVFQLQWKLLLLTPYQ